MTEKHLPWLGRKLLWLETPGAPRQVFWVLALLCAGLAITDLFYHRHAEFEFEAWPAIYGAIGFVVYATVIFLAKALRLIVQRSEDYYAPYSIDVEEEAAAGAERSQGRRSDA